MPVDNNFFQKKANTSLVANTIWKEKRISRADIARKLNLYRSTVTNITSYLVENNVVREGTVRESSQQGGRRPVELSINPDFGCVIGFDIQPSHYRAVILAADGHELWSYKGHLGNIPFEAMFDSALDAALPVQKSLGIPIIAISYSVPGIVKEDYSGVIHSFPFHSDNLNVREIVHKRFKGPVFVENDANTSAWMDVASKNIKDNALSIVADFHEESFTNPEIVGIGAGMGIIINGNVYRGSHNAAGEFKSVSWGKGLFNQSGLDMKILRDTINDKTSLSLWIEDTFRSLVPVISTMDFGTVILHGNPFCDVEWVKQIIQDKVPAFAEIIRNTGCKVVFDSSDECISARGAAMMCLQKLFSIPDLNSEESVFVSWNKNIAFLKNQVE